MKDAFDRLPEVLGDVDVPDQWDAIVARAALANDASPATADREVPSAWRAQFRVWWLAVAATLVLVITGMAVIVRRDTAKQVSPASVIDLPIGITT